MQAFRNKLYQLAQALLQERIYQRSQLQPFDSSHMPLALYQLACQVRAVEAMPNIEILPTFFSDEAVQLLLKMPNQYFLFWTIQQACLIAEGADDEPISVACVQAAIREIRRDTAYKYNLRKGLADLVDDGRANVRRENQIASRAVAGIILVKSCLFERDEIMDNPFFFDPQFVG